MADSRLPKIGRTKIKSDLIIGDPLQISVSFTALFGNEMPTVKSAI